MPIKTMKKGGLEITLNAQPDRLDLRDRPYQPPVFSLPPVWPSNQDTSKFIGSYVKNGLILDQGKEGACTGYGLAAVVNYLSWMQAILNNETSNFKKASHFMLYDLARYYDEWPGEQYDGSSCRGAMKGWHKHGVCADSYWKKSIYPRVAAQASSRKTLGKPYVPSQNWVGDAVKRPLGIYYRIDRESISDMQAAIVAVGAVYVSAEVHPGWSALASAKQTKSKVAHHNLPVIEFGHHTKASGGHAFALVGYNDRGFVVQNSWGSQWGKSGFAVLSYADWLINGMDAWVSGMGVATAGVGHGLINTGNSINGVASKQQSGQNLIKSWGKRKAKPNTPAIEPWDQDDRAYWHAIVAGNDGVVDRSRVDFGDPLERLKRVFLQLEKWLSGKNSEERRVAIIVHGGLNDEAGSIERVKVLAPYFLANGVYPLFYVWKTGLWETIGQGLEDLVKPHEADIRAGGWVRERWDEVVEALIHSASLRWMWRQMKDNAERATNQGHAVQAMHSALDGLKKKFPDLQVHAMGHSAGACVLGHWLSLGARLESLTLFAPAATLEFAKYFKKAVANGQIAAEKFYMHVLSDHLERSDSCPETSAIYGKSLLYLVARGFEDIRKTPLMGLEKALNSANKENDDDLWSPENWQEVVDWRQWLDNNKISVEVWGESRVPTRTILPKDYAKADHGSFDNNCELLKTMLERILDLAPGQSLSVPFEDLRY